MSDERRKMKGRGKKGEFNTERRRGKAEERGERK